jgi:hypothetical protein
MTPAQYDAAIKAEINKSIPRLERVLKSWDLAPDEQVVYNDMLKRLKDGAKTDWSSTSICSCSCRQWSYKSN